MCYSQGIIVTELFPIKGEWVRLIRSKITRVSSHRALSSEYVFFLFPQYLI